LLRRQNQKLIADDGNREMKSRSIAEEISRKKVEPFVVGRMVRARRSKWQSSVSRGLVGRS